jgi:hypothetical protein
LKDYCRGLLLPGQRKSIEPIAARLHPDRVQSARQLLQHIVSKAPWSDEAVMAAVVRQVLPDDPERRAAVLAACSDMPSGPIPSVYPAGDFFRIEPVVGLEAAMRKSDLKEEESDAIMAALALARIDAKFRGHPGRRSWRGERPGRLACLAHPAGQCRALPKIRRRTRPVAQRLLGAEAVAGAQRKDAQGPAVPASRRQWTQMGSRADSGPAPAALRLAGAGPQTDWFVADTAHFFLRKRPPNKIVPREI